MDPICPVAVDVPSSLDVSMVVFVDRISKPSRGVYCSGYALDPAVSISDYDLVLDVQTNRRKNATKSMQIVAQESNDDSLIF